MFSVDFIELLNILQQNPGIKIGELLGSEQFSFAQSMPEPSDEAFAEFTI